ncbi:hypothetical protein E1B28_006104 [Marasmius oreades]|uniref:Uncharacterized protein n=1 Tax=Marasmius oreades TaxID=181124 RepID=A0A9P7UV94_9AGAR|nr:uncharacterized protein E1B28_006104 [Marasmius oreades]KAG7095343.1 hypothetical protein E1B28_006104 [Marasmius oreades]
MDCLGCQGNGSSHSKGPYYSILGGFIVAERHGEAQFNIWELFPRYSLLPQQLQDRHVTVFRVGVALLQVLPCTSVFARLVPSRSPVRLALLMTFMNESDFTIFSDSCNEKKKNPMPTGG